MPAAHTWQNLTQAPPRARYVWTRTDHGGDSHMKGAGMLVGNFELNPRKGTNLGVAQAFFDP